MPIYQLKDVKLMEAIADIGKGRVQLPDFQRSFNWGTKPQTALLDSLQKEYPVGTLLFMELEPGAEVLLGFRCFEGLEEAAKAGALEQPRYLVLDGQQRLTSCLQAFSPPKSASSVVMALDLRGLMAATGGKPKQAVDLTPFLVRRRAGATVAQLLYGSHLLPLCYLTDQMELLTRLNDYKAQLPADTDDLREFVSIALFDYLTPFAQYEFPCVVLPPRMDLETICVVFTNLNSTGLRLSAFDLCVARMAPAKISLREWLKEAHGDENVRLVDVDGTNILQTVALLAGQPPKKAALPKNLNPTHIKDLWKPAIFAIKAAAEVLMTMNISERSLIPYDALVPPLAALASSSSPDIEHFQLSGEFVTKVQRWVHQSALLQRYAEGTDVKQTVDVREIGAWLGGGPTPDILKEPVLWTETLENTGTSGARFKSFMGVLNHAIPRDFLSSQLVGHGEGRVKSDLHHIFPRAWVKTNFGDIKRADRALNLTFLAPKTNKQQSDSPPSVYLKNMIRLIMEAHDKSEAEATIQVKQNLESHLIPERAFQALLQDDFESFLTERATAFRERYVGTFNVPIIAATEQEELSSEEETVELAEEAV